MAESSFTTDIESCYLTACSNNNDLKCCLLRVHIGPDGVCMAYAVPAEDSEPNN